MTTPIHSAADIPARLRALSAEMLEISSAMAYFGGFDTVMNDHANQLAGAAAIAAGWADGMEAAKAHASPSMEEG